MAYLLGLDIGSSSIKAALVTLATGKALATAQAPLKEMAIEAPQAGWAEQAPEMWWQYTKESFHKAITTAGISPKEIKAIGISYQMHGLVAVDAEGHTVRPSIIWCDSRATPYGNAAFEALGANFCLSHYLNNPGNFTAAKLKWVRENEPDTFAKIHKIMLPGDYIAMKLTGELVTTASGLSEAILWDFQDSSPAKTLLNYLGLSPDLIPPIVETFGFQGSVSSFVAAELGLAPGTPVSYRAGDQPNNAFSLKVLHPGETAATAGTSGVIYSVTDQNSFDPQSRVNTFLHVAQGHQKRNGVLLCVNGTGILNAWLRKTLGNQWDYTTMNQLAATASIGSENLCFYPFGNGAERILGNQNPGARLLGLDFNRHSTNHLLRAAQEGIVFALKYGFEILQGMGVSVNVVRAGHANMFLSPVFREAFVNTLGHPLELYDTNGAVGAALGAGVGAGLYGPASEAFLGLSIKEAEEPNPLKQNQYNAAYAGWKQRLNDTIHQISETKKA